MGKTSIWFFLLLSGATIISNFASAQKCTPQRFDFSGTSLDPNWIRNNGDVVISDGTLKMTMRKNASVKLTMKNRIQYGRITARVKAANVDAAVSALVLISPEANIDSLKPPVSQSEIDLEWVGRTPRTVESNFFVGGIPSYSEFLGTHDVGGTIDEFHEYAIEWTPEAIKWYVNDLKTPVRVWTEKDSYSDKYQRKMFPTKETDLVLSLWDGSNHQGWAGNGPLDWAKNPEVRMEVDYIQVDCFDDNGAQKRLVPSLTVDPPAPTKKSTAPAGSATVTAAPTTEAPSPTPTFVTTTLADGRVAVIRKGSKTVVNGDTNNNNNNGNSGSKTVTIPGTVRIRKGQDGVTTVIRTPPTVTVVPDTNNNNNNPDNNNNAGIGGKGPGVAFPSPPPLTGPNTNTNTNTSNTNNGLTPPQVDPKKTKNSSARSSIVGEWSVMAPLAVCAMAFFI